jgi:DNA (cytosine-5)-methyltransferase 1
VLDVFSGAGGFSLGFQMAGYEVIGAIERDKWAAESFAFNHPGAATIIADIDSLTDAEILNRYAAFPPDILLGGPPCQGFSVCRSSQAGDPADPRNSLFQEFIRVARLLNPSIVIMENVPNLAKAKTASNNSVLEIIESELKSLGYHVYSKVLQATDFGIPQIRKRLFILGTKSKMTYPFPEPTHFVQDKTSENLFSPGLKPCPTLWEAISDLPKLAACGGSEISEYEGGPQSEYQRVMRQDANLLCNHKAMCHSARMVARFASMSWGESVSDVPDHLRPFKRNTNGKVSGKGYDQNNRRMYPHRPCHTVPASFYANFVHPFQDRNFTAREGARIQGFPDFYVFKGKPTVVSHKLLGREGRDDERFLCQYSQIGNAVPPLLAKAIAKHLANHWMDEFSYHNDGCQINLLTK